MLHKFYPHHHPLTREAIEWLLAHFLDAAASENWSDLVIGNITVEFPDGIRRAKVRTTNTQFAALDRKNTIEYANGYEPATGALIDRLVPEDGVLFDIGANWGYFSIYLATRPSFHGTVHAFEPIPDTFQDLSGLITDLGLNERVQAHKVALSDVVGEATMSIPGHHSGLARISTTDDGLSVKLMKLDTLGFKRADFLKIDAENHEREVIEGGRQTINEFKPYILFEDTFNSAEFIAAGPRHVSAVLGDMGYQLFLPLWMRPDDHFYPALIGDIENQKLALFPLNYATGRSALPGHTNLLACHSSRVDEMRTMLTIENRSF